MLVWKTFHGPLRSFRRAYSWKNSAPVIFSHYQTYRSRFPPSQDFTVQRGCVATFIWLLYTRRLASVIWRMALMRFSGKKQRQAFRAGNVVMVAAGKTLINRCADAKKSGYSSDFVTNINKHQRRACERPPDGVSRRPNSGSCWTEPVSDIQLFSAQ